MILSLFRNRKELGEKIFYTLAKINTTQAQTCRGEVARSNGKWTAEGKTIGCKATEYRQTEGFYVVSLIDLTSATL